MKKNLEEKITTGFMTAEKNFRRGLLHLGIYATLIITTALGTGFYVKSLYEPQIAQKQQAHYETVQNLMTQYNALLDGAKIERGWVGGDYDKDGLGPDVILQTNDGQMYMLNFQEGRELVRRENNSYYPGSKEFIDYWKFFPIESAGPNDVPPAVMPPIEGAGPSDVPPVMFPIEGAVPEDIPPAMTP